MQIVIDIPDIMYTKIQNGKTDKRTLETVILHGAPLPEGHGRIADMDAAIKCIEEVKGEDAIWAISLIEWACSKRTIIEADEGSEVEV